jgi:hypothetical protein
VGRLSLEKGAILTFNTLHLGQDGKPEALSFAVGVERWGRIKIIQKEKSK